MEEGEQKERDDAKGWVKEKKERGWGGVEHSQQELKERTPKHCDKMHTFPAGLSSSSAKN